MLKRISHRLNEIARDNNILLYINLIIFKHAYIDVTK